MPNQPKTPIRPVRVERELWDRFGEAVKALGFPNRSTELRTHMAEVVAEYERRASQS